MSSSSMQGGDLTNALIGEMMLTRIIKSGLAGSVIDGAVRDAAFIRCQKFPVYAAGVTHRGPYKSGPGEINAPIAIDGMVIAENCEVYPALSRGRIRARLRTDHCL
jgi:regulator of RNase E activity RraA